MRYIFENCEYSKSLIERAYQFNIQAKYFGHDMVDVELVKKAVAFAKHWHNGQTRKSGEPYYSHPIAVASMAMEHKFMTDVICGALLHDVLEDTQCTYKIICQEFTHRIAEIVYRLTRDREHGKISVQQIINEAFLAGDEETLIIKICDRIHNIETIEHISKEKRMNTYIETINAFTSIVIYLNSNAMYRVLLNIKDTIKQSGFHDCLNSSEEFQLPSLISENG